MWYAQRLQAIDWKKKKLKMICFFKYWDDNILDPLDLLGLTHVNLLNLQSSHKTLITYRKQIIFFY
jgi:hypothetical protein